MKKAVKENKMLRFFLFS